MQFEPWQGLLTSIQVAPFLQGFELQDAWIWNWQLNRQ
jgi:hypothetical protein